MTMNRRSLITGLISLVAAPAIVRAGSLMPVKVTTDFVANAWTGSPPEWVDWNFRKEVLARMAVMANNNFIFIGNSTHFKPPAAPAARSS